MRAYWAPLVKYAARLTGSTANAEDIAQEAFVALWKRRATWKPSGAPRTLLYGITRNLVLKERRRRSVREKWAERIRRDVRPVTTPFESAHREELRAALESAIEALPPRRREAFVLARYHRLPLKEIAEVMRISVQTVANHITAAAADLRESLERFSD